MCYVCKVKQKMENKKEKELIIPFSFHRLSCTFHTKKLYGSQEMEEMEKKKNTLQVSLHQRKDKKQSNIKMITTMKKTMILAALCLAMAANATTESEMTMPAKTSSFETFGQGEMTDNGPITKAEMQEVTKKMKHFLSEREKAFLALQTYKELTQAEDCDCYDIHDLQVVWEEKFIDFLCKNPMTLDYPEKEMEKMLGNGYKVATSPDGRLRAYSWYTDRGGSWINFCNVMQYRTDDGNTYVTWEYEITDEEDCDDEEDFEEDDDDENGVGWEWQSFVTKIHEMDTKDGRIYLTQDYDVLSRGFGTQSIQAIAITDDYITAMPIFIVDGKKKSYLMQETLGQDTTDDKFLTYDKKSKTIVIHQYEDEEEGDFYTRDNAKWTKENIVYTFDGEKFTAK